MNHCAAFASDYLLPLFECGADKHVGSCGAAQLANVICESHTNDKRRILNM